MTGWLVVNAFLQTPKFTQLHTLLQVAAQKQGIDLQTKTNAELCCTAQGVFAQNPGDTPNFVLFWDKDILLAQQLADRGLPVYNSARAIAICDDKAQTAYVCRHLPAPKTIPVPFTYENIGYTAYEFLESAGKALGWPMIIKEAKGSFGFGVHLAQDQQQAAKILQGLQGRPAVLQQFVHESRGRDIRINVVGGQVHSAMLRENPADFRSNITGGGTGQAYTPTGAEADLAVAACKATGLTFGGVDILQSKRGPLLCEVNSNPHFKSTLEATGKNMADAIFAHILKSV